MLGLKKDQFCDSEDSAAIQGIEKFINKLKLRKKKNIETNAVNVPVGGIGEIFDADQRETAKEDTDESEMEEPAASDPCKRTRTLEPGQANPKSDCAMSRKGNESDSSGSDRPEYAGLSKCQKRKVRALRLKMAGREVDSSV